jgi:hypothetical protein
MTTRTLGLVLAAVGTVAAGAVGIIEALAYYARPTR